MRKRQANATTQRKTCFGPQPEGSPGGAMIPARTMRQAPTGPWPPMPSPHGYWPYGPGHLGLGAVSGPGPGPGDPAHARCRARP